jgi:hypothetical protein
MSVRVARLEECDADLCNLLCLWNDLVCFLGEVLVGLEDVPVRHLWESFGCRRMDKVKSYKSSVTDSSELNELFVNNFSTRRNQKLYLAAWLGEIGDLRCIS